MGLYLDSAELDEVRQGQGLSVLSGVTTNPTILQKAQVQNPSAHLQALLGTGAKRLFAQVAADEAERMVTEGERLFRLDPARMVIKIPMGPQGLIAARMLHEERVSTCLTAIFSPAQAYLAALAQADWVALYVGRIERLGENGLWVVDKTLQLLAQHHLPTRVLCASIPDRRLATELLALGDLDLTVSTPVFWDLLKHPGTDDAIAVFSRVS